MNARLLSRVEEAIAAVPDPELPPVTITDLGMLVAVREQEGRVEVELVPTFSGCPATELIARDVRAAVSALPGVREVVVRFVAEPVWSPERISPRGRDKLRAFGIAPPGDSPPLLQLGRRLGIGATTTCPLCGSAETVMDSPFGPTPCRSTHFCSMCRNPFEAIKP